MLTFAPLPTHVLIDATPEASELITDFVAVDGLSRGRIVAVADDVQGFKVGDHVLFHTHAANGFRADGREHLSVPAARVVLVLEP